MNPRIVIAAIVVCFLHTCDSPQARAQVLGGLEADYNVDGVVDTADYAVWKSLYGRDAFIDFIGDGNHDGLVDEADYFIWRDQFGLSLDTFPTGFGDPPVIAIDLVRDVDSRPVLDAAGRWQFSLSVIPDPELFLDTPDDVPDQGSGSAIAIELGLQIRDEYNPAHTAVSDLSLRVSGQLFENDPNWDGNAVDALGANNPGISPFGGLVDSQGVDAVGNQIDVSLGTIFFNSDNGGSGHELFTFSAGRPAVDSSLGGLHIAVDVYGGYGFGRYRLVQGYAIFDYPNTFEFFSYNVLEGDVNFDGIVNSDDLEILTSSLNNPGKWTDGDLTGEGLVDQSDLEILLAILVPEPSSVSLLLLGCVSIALQRRMPVARW